MSRLPTLTSHYIVLSSAFFILSFTSHLTNGKD